MPTLNTKHFGAVEFEEDDVVRFPSGIPGFEDQNSFIFLDRPGTAPVLFLQSVSRADLRFPAVPVQVVDPVYNLALHEDDLAALGLPADRQPAIGSDVLCFAVVAAHPNGLATFNLLAPIVLNPRTRQALQAIRADSVYSHEHCLGRRVGQGEACS
ncbi:MAG: flagellar assembly protein FliW [Bryobacteraceae bacterium]